MTIHALFSPDSGFPAAEVEACIREALAQQLEAQVALSPRMQSACEPKIDSLAVVEVICGLEELLGVDLPPTYAPKGGYDDVEACVSDLLAELRKVWPALVKEEQHHDG